MNQGRSVIITGCSSGIGRALAFHLKDRGWRVFATAKERDDAEALAREGLETATLDLASSQSIKDAFASVLDRTGGALSALVNNAGIEMIGAMEDLPRDALREQFETNVFGAMELSQLGVRAMRGQGSGRIVFVGSIACSRVSFPFSGAYAASKHALVACAQALRRELAGTGISVTLVEPGLYRTGLGANSVRLFGKYLAGKPSVHRAVYERFMDHIGRQRNAPGEDRMDGLLGAFVYALEDPHPKTRIAVPALTAFIYGAVQRLCSDKLQDLYLSQKMKLKDKIL